MAPAGEDRAIVKAENWEGFVKIPYYWAGALVGICEGVILFGITPLALQLNDLRNDEKWTSFVQTFLVPRFRGVGRTLKDFEKGKNPGSVDILCLPAVVLEGDSFYDSMQDFDDTQSLASSKTAGEAFDDPDQFLSSAEGDGWESGEAAEQCQRKTLRGRVSSSLRRAFVRPFRRNKKLAA